MIHLRGKFKKTTKINAQKKKKLIVRGNNQGIKKKRYQVQACISESHGSSSQHRGPNWKYQPLRYQADL